MLRVQVGHTPLHRAARAGRIGVVQLLITSAANISLADNVLPLSFLIPHSVYLSLYGSPCC